MDWILQVCPLSIARPGDGQFAWHVPLPRAGSYTTELCISWVALLSILYSEADCLMCQFSYCKFRNSLDFRLMLKRGPVDPAVSQSLAWPCKIWVHLQAILPDTEGLTINMATLPCIHTSAACLVQLIRVVYVHPITQVLHHICFLLIIQRANCIRSRARQVSSNCMVRSSFALEFGWRLAGELKTSLQVQPLAAPPHASFRKGKGPVSPHHSAAPICFCFAD